MGKYDQRRGVGKARGQRAAICAHGAAHYHKRCEEYYGERGEGISWDHYLLRDCSSENDGKNSTQTQEVLKWQ